MYNFFDKLNRVHTKPVTKADDYPTNNAYIYSGYYKVLHPDIDYKCYLPESMPFSRHPNVISVAISHDELHGVCILSKEKAKEICEYLKSNHNQFCDLSGFVSKPLYRLNPFKVYAAFKALNKEQNPRKAVIKYPDTWNIAFLQRPEYRWFYKRCAGITPSLFERIYFTLARIVSIIKWKREEPNLLLFFSLKHLKQQDNLGFEGQIVQMFLNTIVDDMYMSTTEMLSFATRDLPSQYLLDHPWIIG